MVDVGVGERLLRSAVWLERNQPEIEARLCHPIGPASQSTCPASRPVCGPARLAPASQPARQPAGRPPPASQPARPSPAQ